MRIALLGRSTPAHRQAGGMERHLDQIARGLAARGHELEVFTSALAPGQAPDATAEGLRYHYIPGTRPGSYLGGFWRRSRRAFKLAQATQPFDAIISQSAGAWGVMRIPARRRPPCLAILHGTTWGDILTAFQVQPWHPKTYAKALLGLYWASLYTYPLLPRCEGLVAVSAAVAARLRREIPGLRRTVRVIPNGIDLTAHPSADPGASERILYVGRIIADKGVFLLLRAFATVADRFPGSRLGFIGGGKLDALRREAEELALGDRVEITGALDHAQLGERLAEAGLFVLPTLCEEGLPLSLLEAMGSGLPVLSIARGGIVEAVNDGVEGRLLPVAEQRDLAETLGELLAAPETRNRLGAAARRRVETEFSQEAMLSAYDRALRDLIRG